MQVQKSILEIQSQLNTIFNGLNNRQYGLSLDAFNGSSIGKHVRHIFDFYDCIIKGCACGTLDYNDRERNELIEQDIVSARAVFSQLIQDIERQKTDHKLTVVTDFSTNKDSFRPKVDSSVGRELMYAFDHAIHHIAIIKMGIKAAFPQVSIPQEIGVAPSTIRYHSHN